MVNLAVKKILKELEGKDIGNVQFGTGFERAIFMKDIEQSLTKYFDELEKEIEEEIKIKEMQIKHSKDFEKEYQEGMKEGLQKAKSIKLKC